MYHAVWDPETWEKKNKTWSWITMLMKFEWPPSSVQTQRARPGCTLINIALSLLFSLPASNPSFIPYRQVASPWLPAIWSPRVGGGWQKYSVFFFPVWDLKFSYFETSWIFSKTHRECKCYVIRSLNALNTGATFRNNPPGEFHLSRTCE